MSRTKIDSDSPPSVGDRRGRFTLVAQGDDSPEEWAQWLLDLATEYSGLVDAADQAGIGVSVIADDDRERILESFAGKIGISFERQCWEGDHVSGQWVTAWVVTRNIGAIKKKARSIIAATRKAIVRELKQVLDRKYKDAEEDILVDAVTRNPSDDKQQIARLERMVAATRADADVVRQRITTTEHESDELAKISNECLAFLCAVLADNPKRCWAGPFAWWDGKIVVIVSQGGVSIPPSPYASLYEMLAAAGVELINVMDKTVIGYWKRPLFLRPADGITAWREIWSTTAKVPRRFESISPEGGKLASEIHLQAAERPRASRTVEPDH